MGGRLRHKGRFIKKKSTREKGQIVNSLQKKKEKVNNPATNNIEPVESNLIQGPRGVDSTELGKNLRCCQCNDVLHLDNIVDKTRSGLNSILRVKCTKCVAITRVPIGKLHVVNTNKKCKNSDSTTGVVLGAVHAGYGCSGLDKIFACSNMPTISMETFKQYEREVGPAIEETAQESCKKAAKEECFGSGHVFIDAAIDMLHGYFYKHGYNA
ncbi:hypothetical protein PV326_011844 [Microctonus aethiopoides]|nr:hypothetical protein PV326_011844 [Microctonus aethiopoides]